MVTTKRQRHATTITRLTLFRHLFLIPLTFLIYATASATDLYSVTSDAEVPVRSGQGSGSKVLALLQNEETVTALEDAGSWVKIRTATGTEGWMLKRYLSSAPSVDDTFTLPAKNTQIGKQTALSEKSIPLGEKNLHASQSEAKFSLENKMPIQSNITNSLPTEQTLNEPETNKSIEDLKNKLAVITKENKELRENERIKWFLAGGGVFVCGWLIGLITCRSRKRKPSLL